MSQNFYQNYFKKLQIC